MKLFYQSFLLILLIQFSTILSQSTLKWRRIQKPIETTTNGYDNPTTTRMIYKSMRPRVANLPPESPSITDSLVDENSPANSRRGADHYGIPDPTNPEDDPERKKDLDTAGIGEAKVIGEAEVNNPELKFGTDPSNLNVNETQLTEITNPNPNAEHEDEKESNQASLNVTQPTDIIIYPNPKLGTVLPKLEGETESNEASLNVTQPTEIIYPNPKLGTVLPKLEDETESNQASLNVTQPTEIIYPNPKLGTVLPKLEGETESNEASLNVTQPTEIIYPNPKLGTVLPKLEDETESNQASLNVTQPTEIIYPNPKLGTVLPKLEGETESNEASLNVTQPTEIIYPNPKLGTVLPKLEDETESNESVNEVNHPSNLEVNTKNNKALMSPSMPFVSVAPTNQRGDFVLQETDYLTKNSLLSLIRSSGGLEKIVKEYNEDVSKQCVLAEEASFTQKLDVFNKAKMNTVIRSKSGHADLKAMYWKKLKNQPNVGQSPLVDRMVREIVDLVGPACLPTTESQEFEIAKSSLERGFRKRTIKVHQSNGSSILDKEMHADDVDTILAMENNTSYQQKLYYWTKWHLATDNQSQENFAIYAHTLNKAAKLQGLRNGGELMNRVFHDPWLNQTVARLWDQIKPTIRILKEFVIKNLKELYGKDYKYMGRHIPAHLIGSLQGNNWESLYPTVKPYPCLEDKPDLAEADVYNITYYVYCQNSKKLTDSMKIPRNFKFCESLIYPNYKSGNVDCRPKGYDFCKGITYAVPVCATEKRFERDVHLELEKMFYAAEYNKQPFVLRKSPHPGLEHAIALLFASQTEKLNLGEGQTDEEEDMNLLMLEALRILPQLPYALSLEKFREDVTSGEIAQSNWNKHWWKLRAEYEGIEPEYHHGVRGEFDPAANYDINLVNYQYNRFLGIIMYYQLLQSSCAGSVIKQCKDRGTRAGIQKPLHQCSLLGKADFGAKIRAVQALGSSEDWQVIWRNLTGTNEINARALNEYFKPATDYMSQQTTDDITSYWWAILLGIMIVIAIIIIVVVYIIMKRRKNKKNEVAELAARDNPVPIEEGQVRDEGTYNALESMDLGESSAK